MVLKCYGTLLWDGLMTVSSLRPPGLQGGMRILTGRGDVERNTLLGDLRSI